MAHKTLLLVAMNGKYGYSVFLIYFSFDHNGTNIQRKILVAHMHLKVDYHTHCSANNIQHNGVYWSLTRRITYNLTISYGCKTIKSFFSLSSFEHRIILFSCSFLPSPPMAVSMCETSGRLESFYPVRWTRQSPTLEFCPKIRWICNNDTTIIQYILFRARQKK